MSSAVVVGMWATQRPAAGLARVGKRGRRVGWGRA